LREGPANGMARTARPRGA